MAMITHVWVAIRRSEYARSAFLTFGCATKPMGPAMYARLTASYNVACMTISALEASALHESFIRRRG
jgi:hypothetical protein